MIFQEKIDEIIRKHPTETLSIEIAIDGDVATCMVYGRNRKLLAQGARMGQLERFVMSLNGEEIVYEDPEKHFFD